ncbi:hypothetical protein [Streptomyces niveus]|uniref:hypothetical protein n=1 Tax=Streptomyces niveus TaxID=193462 RepID=UPI0003C5E036|nr:hypothetical protein [Streptomyces niveus]EST23035.1 hypothetical protein M877_28360 [Streptomyces niveus NCIMB 11891]
MSHFSNPAHDKESVGRINRSRASWPKWDSKHKLIVLIVVAVLAMAVLFYVNLQHVRDTGSRRAVTSGEVQAVGGGPLRSDLDGVLRWSHSDAP